MHTLFDLSGEAEKYVPNFCAEVYDISHISDEDSQHMNVRRALPQTGPACGNAQQDVVHNAKRRYR